MSLTMLAAAMAALLLITIASALWRCSHPYRMRYRRCETARRRTEPCRRAPRRHT
ncbi:MULTISPECIES: hypothetical protein [unclassified Cupriavidus]|uniref:hypothetical protein n=1 Tax=unclassified Cupriavidus TaxID=2640874 RepID=UPI0014850CE5|nr:MULTISPECIES: hypothetical protein [unclassified Cupriavidus]